MNYMPILLSTSCKNVISEYPILCTQITLLGAKQLLNPQQLMLVHLLYLHNAILQNYFLRSDEFDGDDRIIQRITVSIRLPVLHLL